MHITTTSSSEVSSDRTPKRGSSTAEKHAAGVAGGAAAGIALGLFLGFRLNSGATKIERRLLDLREAWDIIRH